MNVVAFSVGCIPLQHNRPGMRPSAAWQGPPITMMCCALFCLFAFALWGACVRVCMCCAEGALRRLAATAQASSLADHSQARWMASLSQHTASTATQAAYTVLQGCAWQTSDICCLWSRRRQFCWSPTAALWSVLVMQICWSPHCFNSPA